MDRESFLETVKKQYAEEVRESYISSEDATGKVDYEKLVAKLEKVGRAASAEGMRPAEYTELIEEVLPHEVYEEYKNFGRKKAA